MTYDPEHHHRRSIRLPGYDYASPGAYFVTLCTADRSCLFGDVVDGVMRLNEYGEIAQREWLATARIRREVELDAFMFMPNHAHVVLWFVANVGADGRPPLPADRDPSVGAQSPAPLHAAPLRAPRSLGALVAGYKSTVTKQINILRNMPGADVWQRNYYEHVIRNDRALDAIRAYIVDNPARWEWDTYHPSPRGRDARAVELLRLLEDGDSTHDGGGQCRGGRPSAPTPTSRVGENGE